MRRPNYKLYIPIAKLRARTSGVYEEQKDIKYESELNHEFGKEIAHKAHGENLFACIQCGTCSGTCVLSHYMDYTPRRIIAMVRGGFEEEVLGCSTIWLCASCYSCTVECPKQIRITDIMYALKQKAIAKHLYPKRFPIPILAEEFYKRVAKHGRNSEGRLMINIARRTNPLNLLKYSSLGLKLFTTGRIVLKEETVKNKAQIRKLLLGVKNAEEEKT